jgi:hypothetical protein
MSGGTDPKFQQIPGGQRMNAFNLRASLNLLDIRMSESKAA